MKVSIIYGDFIKKSDEP